jgi:FlaA1/EpsC-like NDP-sugar epimerase
VLVAGDASIVSTMVSGAIVVVRAGATERAAAAAAVKQLRMVGARLLGAVLNDPDAKVPSYGGHYYYHKYYGEAVDGATPPPCSPSTDFAPELVHERLYQMRLRVTSRWCFLWPGATRPSRWSATWAASCSGSSSAAFDRWLEAFLLRRRPGWWRWCGCAGVRPDLPPVHGPVALRLHHGRAAACCWRPRPGTLLLVGVRALLLGVVTIPLSVLLIEWVLTTQLTGALWVAYRTGFERLRHSRWQNGGDRRRTRVLIVGAGEAGNVLAREIRRYPTGYELVGFVDDDPMKWGDWIQGWRSWAARRTCRPSHGPVGAEELILAVPSARPGGAAPAGGGSEGTGLTYKVLPGIREVLDGEVGLSQLREVRIEDLLGRDPVELELPELARDLEGQCVLITGRRRLHRRRAGPAGGAPPPRPPRDPGPGGDAAVLPGAGAAPRAPGAGRGPGHRGRGRPHGRPQGLRRVHRPDRVFHAAAYKHVPMMEVNPEQAIRNNVIGTRIVAEEAGLHRCEKFVLVSTDKAVEPSSVMGATKRLAELVVLGLDDVYPDTAFGAVRFGNVLGSAGSVIPIFQQQIERNEPLTITHPDVTRYFMTIPEAVQLILQASLLEELRGHIAMLEMGEPVRIVDLARNMLRLAGWPSGNGQHVRLHRAPARREAPRGAVGAHRGEHAHRRAQGPDHPERERAELPGTHRGRPVGGGFWFRSHRGTPRPVRGPAG